MQIHSRVHVYIYYKVSEIINKTRLGKTLKFIKNILAGTSGELISASELSPKPSRNFKGKQTIPLKCKRRPAVIQRQNVLASLARAHVKFKLIDKTLKKKKKKKTAAARKVHRKNTQITVIYRSRDETVRARRDIRGERRRLKLDITIKIC